MEGFRVKAIALIVNMKRSMWFFMPYTVRGTKVVEFINDHAVDRGIMGTMGHRKRKARMVGSHTEKIVTISPVPVIFLKKNSVWPR